MDAAERKDRIAALTPWVLACAAFLHLEHWTITVSEDHPVDGASASMLRWRGQLDAEFLVADRFFILDDRQQREVLAHELLHAHLRPIWEAWVDLDEILGKPAYTVFARHASIAEEQVVEALARVIAPLLPAKE